MGLKLTFRTLTNLHCPRPLQRYFYFRFELLGEILIVAKSIYQKPKPICVNQQTSTEREGLKELRGSEPLPEHFFKMYSTNL